MATNRITRVPRARATRVTAEVLAWYRKARALLDQHSEAIDIPLSEEEENIRCDYLEASLALHCALGRKPWEPDILDTAGCNGDEKSRGTAYAEGWADACALRSDLEQLAADERL
jgi:hypothetical protein